jgi:hypothetical protein
MTIMYAYYGRNTSTAWARILNFVLKPNKTNEPTNLLGR